MSDRDDDPPCRVVLSGAGAPAATAVRDRLVRQLCVGGLTAFATSWLRRDWSCRGCIVVMCIVCASCVLLSVVRGQVYDFMDAPKWACDATQQSNHLAIVFARRASPVDTVETADADPLSLGLLTAALLGADVHVYEYGIAQRMVDAGCNKFHGGAVVGMVPLVKLGVPGNMKGVVDAMSKVYGRVGSVERCCVVVSCGPFGEAGFIIFGALSLIGGGQGWADALSGDATFVSCGMDVTVVDPQLLFCVRGALPSSPHNRCCLGTVCYPSQPL